MRKTPSILSLAAALTSTSAFAANSVVIEQVGSGHVTVTQSGKGNSVEIRQNVEAAKPIDKDKIDEKVDLKNGKAAKKSADYQKAVVTDPTLTPRGRAQAVIEKNRPGNSISIYQQGDSNSAVTSQSGDDNALLLEQEGMKNHARRTQEGQHNQSKIIQNGEIVEDSETYEEK